MTFTTGKTKETVSRATLDKAAHLAGTYVGLQPTHYEVSDYTPLNKDPKVEAARIAFTDFLDGLSDEELRDIEVLCYQRNIGNAYDSFSDGWDDLATRNPNPTHAGLVRDVLDHAVFVSRL
ncbi:hypothetical protein ACLUXI_01900 [Bifidobacterium apri]|uniref:hypothetical protein n=1 Tax=Bifidobacterium apri TaxID=1769423 RepID=UPI0039923EFE